MKTPNNPSNLSSWEQLLMRTKLFNVDHSKAIESLKAISKVIFVFALLFIGTYLFQFFRIESGSVKHFNLLISNEEVDLLPLYRSHTAQFVFIALYEVIKLALIAMIFYNFIRFLSSLDKQNPFKNVKSKQYIIAVAMLCVLFFLVDVVGSIHLTYLENELSLKDHVSIFHFEFLFLVYFVNVFAFIFKRGVDLHNEIELVI